MSSINHKQSKNSTSKIKSKRIHSSLSSPEPSPQPSKIPTKMPGNSDPLTIETIRALLSEQTKQVTTELKSLGDEIKAEFQSKINELNNKIDANQKHVQSELNELKTNVDKCMEHVNGSDDDLRRISQLNELKISGIEHKNDENLNEIFNSIAWLVNFDLSVANNVPTVTRILKRDTATNTTKPTKVIIVKFVANHIRESFYTLYLNKIAAKQPIMSENIGLQKGTRIIIGENLTANNATIFSEAGKLKRLGKLCQVFTKNGLVHVKATKSAKAKAIKSQRQLELFTLANPPSNEQALAQTSNPTSKPAAAATPTTTTAVSKKNDQPSVEQRQQ